MTSSVPGATELFILHALFKFQLGTAAFANFVLKPADLPLVGTLSWFVPTMEIVAGILLIVGLLTRLAAVLLATEMVFTGFVYKLADLHTGVLRPHGMGGAALDFVYLLGTEQAALHLAAILIWARR
ncbi:DoxX family protein [Streptomyces chartreusis]|uniref:DoxX family protein n=1 Tax=Streptomyces chartreusis TaxID=1969 RepID=UPI0037F7E869